MNTRSSPPARTRGNAIAGAVGAVALTFAACGDPTTPHPPLPPASETARAELVKRVRAAGVQDTRVLAALGAVPREAFVPADQRAHAYDDRPLPIGHGQTISQPTVVGLMSEALRLEGGERVLEIGTGSGYQAAVLARLAREVWTIEIDPELATTAAHRLASLGLTTIHVRAGDGFFGWAEVAPFDAILLTAATPEIPGPLVNQLADGGRLVAPMEQAGGEQTLERLVRRGDRVERETLGAVVFVPMTGAVRRR
jgi:protein-L-isoaspartate(D-aspartate) O-methyltransferase